MENEFCPKLRADNDDIALSEGERSRLVMAVRDALPQEVPVVAGTGAFDDRWRLTAACAR